MTARSDHLQATPDDRFIDIDPSWLDFGADDPLDAQCWLNACADCGGAPSLAMNELRWQVRCDCGRAAAVGAGVEPALRVERVIGAEIEPGRVDVDETVVGRGLQVVGSGGHGSPRARRSDGRPAGSLS